MFKCIKGLSFEKCDDNGFTLDNEYTSVEEDSEWQLPEDRSYRFIGGEVRLEQEDGTWIEMCKETLKAHFVEVEDKVIVEVKFNNELPTKYDYRHFDAILEGGEIKTFHHHKNNAIPTEEEIIGLTWEGLRELCRKKWYEAIRG